MNIDIHTMTDAHQLAVGEIFYDAFQNDKAFRWCFEHEKSNYQSRFLSFTHIAHGFHLQHGIAKGAFVDGELVGFLYGLTSNAEIPDDDEWWKKMALRCGEVGANRIREWDETTAQVDDDMLCYKISLVGVSTSHQGKGIGKKLLGWLEEQCVINAEFKGIQLDTDKISNVRLYEHLGYSTINERIFLGDSHYVMFKTRARCIV